MPSPRGELSLALTSSDMSAPSTCLAEGLAPLGLPPPGLAFGLDGLEGRAAEASCSDFCTFCLVFFVLVRCETGGSR